MLQRQLHINDFINPDEQRTNHLFGDNRDLEALCLAGRPSLTGPVGTSGKTSRSLSPLQRPRSPDVTVPTTRGYRHRRPKTKSRPRTELPRFQPATSWRLE
ncbi:hypothetical protein ABVK25_006457 [Lepraria finkii]|uniref:Uncharacterized protein n=1 Tax=Lepraria finkii TaxID=1340010 RepID=A0ABR4B6T2_9LECA